MCYCIIFFFNDTATTEIYTLSLHDALPIYDHLGHRGAGRCTRALAERDRDHAGDQRHGGHQDRTEADQVGLVDRLSARSEEHTSELQSRQYLVCRLLLEKKKTTPVEQSDAS